MNDQDRISPNNTNTMSSRQVMRIKKNMNYGIISALISSLVDPFTNSPNQHHKNCLADNKENYNWDLGGERVK